MKLLHDRGAYASGSRQCKVASFLVPVISFFIFEIMKAVVITPKNEEEYNFLTKLLKKLNIVVSTMTEEELEDFGLSKMLKDVDKSKRVSKDSIMKKLKS